MLLFDANGQGDESKELASSGSFSFLFLGLVCRSACWNLNRLHLVVVVMPTHTVTNNLTGEQHHVVCEAAPGAELLDKDCRHGSDFDMRKGLSEFQQEFHPLVQQYMMRVTYETTNNDPVEVLLWSLRYWNTHRDVLFRDFCGEIPAEFWSMAVCSSCSEQGAAFYSRLTVIASRVTACLSKKDAPSLPDCFDQLKTELLPPISTNAGLYTYMHEHCVCPCMQYVAAAAASGDYDNEASMESRPLCGNCKTAVNRSKRCSRCRLAAYCSKDCQKKAWKKHKKICLPLE